jgi:ABC-type molybdenum transport system ATPase subunit/photorepair protein PhrA
VVLTFIDQLGRRPETHLIYVSHHWEEAPPCITHALRFRRHGVEGYRYESTRNR